jgi:hypothetical protein
MVKGSDENFREPDDRGNDDSLEARRYGNVSRKDAQDGPRSREQIQADIDRTRAKLDVTVDKLQERLDPEVLAHRAFDACRETATDVIQSVSRVLKENPIPAALICIGAAWLIVNVARNGKRPSPPVRMEPEDFEELEDLEIHGETCTLPTGHIGPEVF